jgi:aconitase A
VSATACVTCIGIQERKEEEEEIEKNRAAKALLDQMKLPATANRILTGTL